MRKCNFSKIIFFNVYFEREERASKWGMGRERGRESQADFTWSASSEPNMGLDDLSQNHESDT